MDGEPNLLSLRVLLSLPWSWWSPTCLSLWSERFALQLAKQRASSYACTTHVRRMLEPWASTGTIGSSLIAGISLVSCATIDDCSRSFGVLGIPYSCKHDLLAWYVSSLNLLLILALTSYSFGTSWIPLNHFHFEHCGDLASTIPRRFRRAPLFVSRPLLHSNAFSVSTLTGSRTPLIELVRSLFLDYQAIGSEKEPLRLISSLSAICKCP